MQLMHDLKKVKLPHKTTITRSLHEKIMGIKSKQQFCLFSLMRDKELIIYYSEIRSISYSDN